MDLSAIAAIFGLALNVHSTPVNGVLKELDRKLDQLILYQNTITPAEKVALKMAGRDYLYESLAGKKISPEEIDRHIKTFFSRPLFGDYCQLNLLPSTLPSLTSSDLVNVYPFVAPSQTDDFSCGHWTVVIALAVLKAFHKGVISSRCIAADARSFLMMKGRQQLETLLGRQSALNFLEQLSEQARYLKLVEAGVQSFEWELAKQFPGKFEPDKHEYLDAEHIFRLSTILSLEGRFLYNFHILSFAAGRNEGIFFDMTEPHMPAAMANAHHTKEQLRDLYTDYILNDFVDHDEAIHFFVCHLQLSSTLPHWIVLVLVKQQKKPVMIKLDPLNVPTTAESDAAAYIKFLFERFMRPFYPVARHKEASLLEPA